MIQHWPQEALPAFRCRQRPCDVGSDREFGTLPLSLQVTSSVLIRANLNIQAGSGRIRCRPVA